MSEGDVSRELLALSSWRELVCELGLAAGGAVLGLDGMLLEGLVWPLLLDELLDELGGLLLGGLLGVGSLGLGELGDSCLQPLISRLNRVIASRVLPIFIPYESCRLFYLR